MKQVILSNGTPLKDIVILGAVSVTDETGIGYVLYICKDNEGHIKEFTSKDFDNKGYRFKSYLENLE